MKCSDGTDSVRRGEAAASGAAGVEEESEVVCVWVWARADVWVWASSAEPVGCCWCGGGGGLLSASRRSCSARQAAVHFLTQKEKGEKIKKNCACVQTNDKNEKNKQHKQNRAEQMSVHQIEKK